MTTKYVKFCLPYKLSCANATRKDVVLCLQSADLIVQPDPACLTPITTIDGEICQAYNICDSCTQIKWNYTVSYDDTQLTNPSTPLVAGDIVGVFCRDCQTDWVEQQLSCFEQPLPCTTDTSTVNLGFDEDACLTADVIGPEYPVLNETDLIYAITNNLNMVIWGTVTLTADRTISTSVRVINGGQFITSGHILTLNGPFTAGAFQTFVVTSATQIVFSSQAVPYIFLEWFGAVGNGTVDDTTAIQYAVDCVGSGSGAFIPLMPLNNTTYRISSISVPIRMVMISFAGRTQGPKFKANTAGLTLFQLSNTAHETGITFKGGIVIDGNSLANTTGIAMGKQSSVEIDSLQFQNLDTAINVTGDGFIRYIRRCRFSTTIPTCIQVGGDCNALTIRDCMFASASSNAHIYSDSTWTGGDLLIKDCTFDPAVVGSYTLNLTRKDAGTPTLHVVVDGNRIDGSSSVTSIYIGQYVIANIINNAISGNTSPRSIICDGDECYIGHNYLSDFGITFGTLSRQCVGDSQGWGTGVTQWIDSGSYNRIVDSRFASRIKGTTAQRPSPLLATGQFGILYMDTTLDADGKPIWWNGTAWVDATGAVV